MAGNLHWRRTTITHSPSRYTGPWITSSLLIRRSIAIAAPSQSSARASIGNSSSGKGRYRFAGSCYDETKAPGRDHQNYLRLGGLGFLLGDSNLSYPRDCGPVWAGSVRAHVDF